MIEELDLHVANTHAALKASEKKVNAIVGPPTDSWGESASKQLGECSLM